MKGPHEQLVKLKMITTVDKTPSIAVARQTGRRHGNVVASTKCSNCNVSPNFQLSRLIKVLAKLKFQTPCEIQGIFKFITRGV